MYNYINNVSAAYERFLITPFGMTELWILTMSTSVIKNVVCHSTQTNLVFN
jgi:hypothetical protein